MIEDGRAHMQKIASAQLWESITKRRCDPCRELCPSCIE